MDRVHKICSNKERPPEGYTWSGRRLPRRQKTSRPNDVWPDYVVSDAAKKIAKQRWAIEKPKLDNARQLRGIFFVEPNDQEFKHIMIVAGRKLEVPMPAAMPCKIPIKSSGETHRSIGKNTLVLLMPTKARDRGYKELDTIFIKITSLQKGWLVQLTTVLCANSVEKEWENWRKSRHGSWPDESQKQERSDRRRKE